ncbi:MAG: hypothetical protein ACJ8AT_10935 [Hyalangium sp.]|uniref:hypothetical protein n=1 Tax=Hyalangium sp. TaxID=2028555 RepID=UPI003899F686
MSESRELREKLEETQAELRRAREHLEKLRVYQARERDSLQQQLEGARREVAGLRGRLEELEAEGEEPAPSASLVPPEPAPVVEERPHETGTAIVALVRNPTSLEQAMPALSRVLKLAPVDVRFRLAPMPPAVVARLPLSQAEELRVALRAEGFLAVSCPVERREKASPVMVKQFVLEEQALSVEGTLGESLRVRYAELRLLMRGRSTVAQWETQPEVVSVGGTGLFQIPVHRAVRVRHEQLELFLWVLGKGARLAFTQVTRFTGLGEQRAPSVFENLQRLANELQRRAPHVVLDERFLQMPRFVLPQVDEEQSQELLAELLLQAIEEGLWL